MFRIFTRFISMIIRDDKTPNTATNLQELENLYTASKQHMDIDLEIGK